METINTQWTDASIEPDQLKGRVIVYMAYVNTRNPVRAPIEEVMRHQMHSHGTAVVKDWGKDIRFCTHPQNFYRSDDSYKILAWMYEEDLMPTKVN